MNPYIIAKKFIIEMFPLEDTVLITGSSARSETIGIKSDIDIVVFKEKIGFVYSELVKFEGVDIDLIFIPIGNLELLLNNDIILKRGKLLHMIANGVILVDKNLVLVETISLCKQLYDIGPKSTPIFDLKKLVTIIKGRIKDLEVEKDKLVYVCLLNEINQYLMSLVFAYNNIWIGGARWNARLLKIQFPDISELILIGAEIENRKIYLSKIEKLLNNLPKKMLFQNTSFLSDKVPEIYGVRFKVVDYLEFIKTNYISVHSTNNLIIIPNTDPSNDFSHIIFNNVNQSNFDSQTSSSGRILYTPIENYCDLSELYGTEIFEIKKKLLKIGLVNFRNFLSLESNWNIDTGIFISINILLTFVKVSGFSKKDVLNFTAFLNNKWSVYLNENIPTTLKSMQNTIELNEKILEHFWSKYEEKITESYYSVISSWEEMVLEDEFSQNLLDSKNKILEYVESSNNFGCWYNPEKLDFPMSNFEFVVWSDILKSQFAINTVTPNNLIIVTSIVQKLFT
jgi:hypothetical protein